MRSIMQHRHFRPGSMLGLLGGCSFGSELIVKSLSFEVEAEDVAGYQKRRQ